MEEKSSTSFLLALGVRSCDEAKKKEQKCYRIVSCYLCRDYTVHTEDWGPFYHSCWLIVLCMNQRVEPTEWLILLIKVADDNVIEKKLDFSCFSLSHHRLSLALCSLHFIQLSRSVWFRFIPTAFCFLLITLFSSSRVFAVHTAASSRDYI